MSETVPQLLTSGVLAEEAKGQPERVRYILATRPHIKPVARAGMTRLYSREAIEAVRIELAAIDSRRARREVAPDACAC